MEKIYLDLNKAGYSPLQIKEMIIEELGPLFRNKELLEKQAIEVMLSELINLYKIKNHDKYYKQISKGVDLINESKRLNAEEQLKSIEEWSPIIENSTYNYWTIYELDRSRDGLSLEAFTKLTMDQLDDILEGLIKPYSYYFLNNILVFEGNLEKIKSLKEQTFGYCVQEIIKSGLIKDLFEMKIETAGYSQKLGVNQLRNVAAHKSYEIKNGLIYLYLKNSKNEVTRTLKLSRDQLQTCLVDAFHIWNTLKIIYTLFIIDNIDTVNPFLKSEKGLRDKQLMLHLNLGIHSQGFDIKTFEADSKESILILQDVHSSSFDRASHASQFLFHLWRATKSKVNIIEYIGCEGEPMYRFEIEGDICNQINEGKLDKNEQAMQMKVIYLDKKNF